LHPNEDCIATGTTNGKIILWYNYLAALTNPTDAMDDNNNSSNRKQKLIKPTTSILHWHSLPVLSLWFTIEGSYLLSGGYECVLVKWLFKTGQKDFKPRLAAPIKEICSSKDNSLYVTRHLDNSK
jgi:NET1-associated nuclear protein 1 (U3 small nucleolar RNA-associated protein 17)